MKMCKSEELAENGGEVAAREWRREAATLTWRPPIRRSDVEAGHARRGWTYPTREGSGARVSFAFSGEGD